jgi:hypothetical protein
MACLSRGFDARAMEAWHWVRESWFRPSAWLLWGRCEADPSDGAGVLDY